MSLSDITGDDPARRMAAFGRLMRSELFVLLAEDEETPRRFDIGDAVMVLGFEELAVLGQFAAGPAPYAAVPGRVLVAQLAAHGLSIGLNFGSENAVQLAPDTLGWLHQVTAELPAPITLPEMRLPPEPGLAAALTLALEGLFPEDVTLWLTSDAEGPIILTEHNNAALGRAVQEAALFAGIEPLLRVATIVGEDIPDTHCLRVISRAASHAVPKISETDVPAILRNLK